jgi:glucose/arabinose dehydrogenase/plastocyanin
MKCIDKAFLVSLCLSGFLSQRLDGATTVVGMSGFSFMPPTVTIQVGDTVMWTNMDSIAHTTTSGANPPTSDGLWNSGALGSHQTFSHTFTQAGTFPYFCEFHFGFGMRGTVIVQGGNGPPTVSITSPTNGATYLAPADLMISAAASESGGSISKVQFLDGTNSLGVASANPYTLAVTLYPGFHTLEAVATDTMGASATSAVVTVTVTTVSIPDPVSNHIAKGDITIELKTILAGLVSPLGLAMPDDSSGRMFVYDQAGLAQVVIGDNPLPTPLIDLRDRLVLLTTYDERGLLGLATHPNFAQHPLIYTFTSEPVSASPDFTFPNPGGFTNCQSVLAEWRMDTANTNQVDLSSRRELLRLDKPYMNHNGGEIRFGADGYLYISTGDGGLANDVGAGHLVAGGNAQSLQQPYGKILRIDVSGTNSANAHYGIPTDNPFVGQNAVQEIYAYGLRNPYRFSFDSQTGYLYCSDAGQNTVEEVDLIVKGGNYAWNVKEGSFWFDSIASDTNFGSVVTGPVKPVPPNLIDPLLEYDHFEGHVVIGGFVYHGTQIPQLQGRYVFGDWGSFGAPTARLFYLDTNNVNKEFHIGLDDRPAGIWLKGFGQDTSGEIYVFGSRVLGPAGNTGVMLKIVPAPPPLAIANSHLAGGTNLAVAWTGGSGPYALQEKLSLLDSAWMNAAFTTNVQTSVSLAGPRAFFRVTDTVHQPPTPFTASLSGAAEQPRPVTTSGSGLGVFDLDGNTLRFSISYSGLSGPALAAHIHGPAGTDAEAPIILSLQPYAAGPVAASGAFSGTLVISDQFKSLILSGQTYVNVHTVNNPGGEIRGQIAPVLMQSSLSSAYDVPPLTDNGNAFGECALVGNQLSFNIAYRNLSGAASSVDLRGPAPIFSNAPVLISLVATNAGPLGTNGAISGTVNLSPVELTPVLSGLTYLNIATASHPGGEIRGQLLPQTVGVPLSVSMNGASEQPTPLSTGAVGSGFLSLEGETLRFNITYSGLSAPAATAQIHGPATTKESALVIISLAPFNGGSFAPSGQLSGSVQLDPAQRDAALGGMTYVEITTSNNPEGEIRGQVAPMLMQSDLSGVNERPNSVASSGAGYGALVLVGNQVTFNITYTGLRSAATGAGINGPAPLFAPGPALIDLAPFNGGGFGTFGTLAGDSALVVSNLNSLIDGQTYINISTVTNTTGEIRGQIAR